MAHKNKTNYSPYTARQNSKKQNPQTNNSKDQVASRSSLLGKHKKPVEIYSVEQANDRLYDIFKNHQFNLVTHEQRKQLAHFYHLLMLNQEKENFTRLLSIKDIAIKHFIDSLIITNHCDLSFPLLDVGTGPGFPGIPLKILFPEDKILLGEGVQKRVSFLKHARQEMNLKNLDIIGRNINNEFVYPVQGVITRAVEDLSNTMTNVMSCLQEGGFIYFMKGPNVDPEIKMAHEKYSEYFRLVKDHAYSLPNTPHNRRLVIFQKVKSMPLPDDEITDHKLLED